MLKSLVVHLTWSIRIPVAVPPVPLAIENYVYALKIENINT